MSRYRGSSARAKAEAFDQNVDAMAQVGSVARGLYESVVHHFSDPKWCVVCHRVYDAHRERGCSRGVGETNGKRWGGEPSLYCSNHCANRGRDTRYTRTLVWRKCHGCGTHWADWAIDAPTVTAPVAQEIPTTKIRRLERLTCPPPWTAGEPRLYSLLRSPCEDVPELAKEIDEYRKYLAERRRIEREKAVHAAGKRTVAEQRTEARAKARAERIERIMPQLKAVDAFMRLSPEERDALRAGVGHTGTNPDLEIWAKAVVAHLAHCANCKTFPDIHAFRRATILAAQGRLGEWTVVETEQERLRLADIARYEADR
jgi:hypothetical protein